MQASMFKPFSVGIAAENKALKSKDLTITPIESLPFLDGELVSTPTPIEFSGVDEGGQNYQGQMFTDNVLVATWLPESSNRVTAPDIRRGERVMIYRMENVDKFYWRPLGLDDHLRKLETIVFAISGNPTEGKEVLDTETCYFLEMSSHTKQVTFQTSKANGEPFSYKFQFNTGDGTVTLDDDIGQQFHIDSNRHYLLLKNMEGSKIEIDKKDIRINAVDTIHAKAGKSIILETGGTKMTLTPGGTTLKTPSFKGSQ
jgi:hypothetical protein